MPFVEGGSAPLDPPYKVFNGLPEAPLTITKCNLCFSPDLPQSRFQEGVYSVADYQHLSRIEEKGEPPPR